MRAMPENEIPPAMPGDCYVEVLLIGALGFGVRYSLAPSVIAPEVRYCPPRLWALSVHQPPSPRMAANGLHCVYLRRSRNK